MLAPGFQSRRLFEDVCQAPQPRSQRHRREPVPAIDRRPRRGRSRDRDRHSVVPLARARGAIVGLVPITGAHWGSGAGSSGIPGATCRPMGRRSSRRWRAPRSDRSLATRWASREGCCGRPT